VLDGGSDVAVGVSMARLRSIGNWAQPKGYDDNVQKKVRKLLTESYKYIIEKG